MKVCHDCKREYGNHFFCTCKDYIERGMNICKTCERERRYRCNAEKYEYLKNRHKIRAAQSQMEKDEWWLVCHWKQCSDCTDRFLKSTLIECPFEPNKKFIEYVKDYYRYYNRPYKSLICEECFDIRQIKYIKAHQDEFRAAKAAVASLNRDNIRKNNTDILTYKSLLEIEFLRLKTLHILKHKTNNYDYSSNKQF